ncbi:uncharacterized protein LOC144745194 isoform X2 [Ciona intestinalis]
MAFNVFMSPPTYSPDCDLGNFIKLFDSYCESVKASDDVKRHMFITAISQDLRWQLQGKDPCIFDLSYKTLTERALGLNNNKVQRENLREELMKRRQLPRESTRDFAFTVKNLGDRAYPNVVDEAAIRNEVTYLVLTCGLANREFAKTIPSKLDYSRDFWTAADFAIKMDVSENLEVASVDSRTRDSRVSNSSSTTSGITESLKAIQISIEGLQRMMTHKSEPQHRQPPNPQVREFYRPTANAASFGFRNRECYGCRQLGHIRRFCPNVRQVSRPYHVSSNNNIQSAGMFSPTTFPRREPNVRKNKTDNEYCNERTETVGCLKAEKLHRFAHVTVNESVVRALVDSGSTVTLMRADVLSKIFGNKKLSAVPRHMRFVGPSDKSVAMLGVARIPVTVAGLTTNVDVFVSPDIGHEMIIGLDFLENNQCKLCYSSNLMSVGESTVPLLSKSFIPKRQEVYVTEPRESKISSHLNRLEGLQEQLVLADEIARETLNTQRERMENRYNKKSHGQS